MMRIFSITKNMFIYALSLIVSLSLFVACDNDDDVASYYTVSVEGIYPEGYNQSLEGMQVKAVNLETNRVKTATTDANGLAKFDLEGGLYNFTVTQETEDYALNGLKENVQVVSNTTSVSLDMIVKSLQGGLVLKEIYYVGSRTPAGKTYFADQFFEIYNNSDEIIYLDNLGFGTIDPLTSNTPSVWVDEKGDLMDKFPLSGYSFYIKGSGKDHPLEPRTSIVIAVDGINHKEDPAGNPGSPVDLSNATWETYVGDINGGKDADAAGVPNADVLATTITTMNDFMPSVFGSVIMIFQFPEGVDPLEFASNSANLLRKPGTSSSVEYVMIPKEYVVDAVECVNSAENRRFKRLPNDIDAGSIFIEGTYNSQSIRRKVKDIIGGKVIYRDTNNTTEDFSVIDTPTPFVHPTTVDK